MCLEVMAVPVFSHSDYRWKQRPNIMLACDGSISPHLLSPTISQSDLLRNELLAQLAMCYEGLVGEDTGMGQSVPRGEHAHGSLIVHFMWTFNPFLLQRSFFSQELSRSVDLIPCIILCTVLLPFPHAFPFIFLLF